MLLLHCNRVNAKHLRHNAVRVVNALAPALREAGYQLFLEDDRVAFESPAFAGAVCPPRPAQVQVPEDRRPRKVHVREACGPAEGRVSRLS